MKNVFKYILLASLLNTLSAQAMDSQMEERPLLNPEWNQTAKLTRKLLEYRSAQLGKTLSLASGPEQEYLLVYLIGIEMAERKKEATLEDVLRILNHIPGKKYSEKENYFINEVKTQRSNVLREGIANPKVLEILERTKETDANVAVDAYLELIRRVLDEVEHEKLMHAQNVKKITTCSIL